MEARSLNDFYSRSTSYSPNPTPAQVQTFESQRISGIFPTAAGPSASTSSPSSFLVVAALTKYFFEFSIKLALQALVDSSAG